jgi:hypothetical protein
MRHNKRRRTILRLFATLLKSEHEINVLLGVGSGEAGGNVFRSVPAPPWLSHEIRLLGFRWRRYAVGLVAVALTISRRPSSVEGGIPRVSRQLPICR